MGATAMLQNRLNLHTSHEYANFASLDPEEIAKFFLRLTVTTYTP